MTDEYSYEDTSTDDGAAAEAPTESPAPATRTINRAAISGGWGKASETRSANSPYADRLKIDGEQVIKFLEDGPYTSFHFHWIERQGQKSFTCLDRLDEKGCPLCKAGDRPQARFAFNVALMNDDGTHIVKSLEGGVRMMDTLKEYHDSQTKGPLSKNYWVVSKSGKGTSTQTNFQMLKARDLPDDYPGRVALTEADLVALDGQKYDASIVPVPQYKTLQDVATEDLSAD
jgi:hypothetical protein